MQKAKWIVGLLALLISILGSTESSAAIVYSLVADTTGPFTSFGSIALNNNGTVAFYGEQGTDIGGIYSWTGGSLTTIADGSDGFRPGDFGQFPAINDSGVVAFQAVPTGGGQGIYTGTGGTPTEVVFTAGPFLLVGNPDINNSGEVSFRGFLDAGTEEGVFRSDGTTTTTIALEDGPLNVFNDGATLNDSGTVAFHAILDGGGSELLTGNGGALTTIADTTGSLESFPFSLGSPDINNAGTVAFVANLDAGGSGIFTGDGGALTPIVDTTGAFDFLGAPAINDWGQIFYGGIVGSDLALYIGTDRIIGTGDALDGSTITSINYNASGFNNDGSFAFWAQLADGREGVFYAENAAAVPEPNVAALCCLGFGIGALARRRKRQNARS